jgi:two-component system sensor histidine kinase SenX3
VGLEVFGSEEQVTRPPWANLVATPSPYSAARQPPCSSPTRADDGSVEISVVDQGIGIPPDEIDRIFERFYRVDPARHRSTGGTGSGLSIVKHVAATHGGDIRVWSVEGQGLDVHAHPAAAPAPPRGRAIPRGPIQKEY